MDSFYEKTRRDASTGCLEWIGGFCGGSPYGACGYNGRLQKAHRVAWQLQNGDIPEGKIILHTCDNPRCVDIDHLRLGDQALNMRDMVRKGRGNTQKLTLEDRDQIIEIYAAGGISQTSLARNYGVAVSTISRIVNGKRWAWVDNVIADICFYESQAA